MYIVQLNSSIVDVPFKNNEIRKQFCCELRSRGKKINHEKIRWNYFNLSVSTFENIYDHHLYNKVKTYLSCNVAHDNVFEFCLEREKTRNVRKNNHWFDLPHLTDVLKSTINRLRGFKLLNCSTRVIRLLFHLL